MEKQIERLILASRWLQTPLYLGLIAVLVLLCVKFFQELWHLSHIVWGSPESEVVLIVLTLVDLVMVANLMIMVIISGYENFVSRLDVEQAQELLSWFGKLDAGTIKIKLAGSIVAISSIHLLKAFLNVNDTPSDKLMWLVLIHLTFVVSALMMAYLDKISGVKKEGEGHKKR